MPTKAEETLFAAGLTAPSLEASVADGPLEGEEVWSEVVTFSSPSDEVEAWVAGNFPGGIESEANKGDIAAAVERLDTGGRSRATG